MIEHMKLQFGAYNQSSPLELDVGPLTIFVGPNNSGKSKLLVEIRKYCSEGSEQFNGIILNQLLYKHPSKEICDKIREELIYTPEISEHSRRGIIELRRNEIREQVHANTFNIALNMPANNGIISNAFARYVLRYYTLLLDGKKRTELTEPNSWGDFLQKPENPIAEIAQSEDKRKEIRRIVFDAFGEYFVLDPNKSGFLRIRLSKFSPLNSDIELGLGPTSRSFHNAANDIAIYSDGVKAFVGLIMLIVAGDPKVLLIDEPEAFLHPSLSYKLGKEISLSASKTGKKVFVATHSADFVMGCIQSGAPVNIVRLTYNQGVATARLLPSDVLKPMMQKPLLRSTGILRGLFYDSVIVTEGDSDRAFYQEINERLLYFAPNRGVANCLFVNAQNKSTIYQIVGLLRSLGIPSAGIIDIDLVKMNAGEWSNLLQAIDMPDTTRTTLGHSRELVKKYFIDARIDMKKGGINLLEGTEKRGAEDLFDQLNEYGIFTVRQGELEKWLPQLGVDACKERWLVEMFSKMGDDPDSREYVCPGNDDVWAFVESIGKWLKNPMRKGIPGPIPE